MHLFVMHIVAVVDLYFGSSNNSIQFGGVAECLENESSLFDCSYNASVQCAVNSHAGVICAGKGHNS